MVKRKTVRDVIPEKSIWPVRFGGHTFYYLARVEYVGRYINHPYEGERITVCRVEYTRNPWHELEVGEHPRNWCQVAPEVYVIREYSDLCHYYRDEFKQFYEELIKDLIDTAIEREFTGRPTVCGKWEEL